ncbi:hypothetical protein [Streptomyces sp. NBC_00199]|uniref:hypothetical protein n=1 Tax=Streptomyces sp. NBC_00199 TaxID=2975678 RepID=UPI002254CD0E|nr:hypothetical protein [Streptomyces sp. NBC_00199]MCX5267795.1 hypothetical protein [Streptomyces sp. NBC_00199]
MNDQNQATTESGELHPSPEDGSQSITAPTPEVGRHGDGDAGPARERSSPEDGSRSIDTPTPEVGRHSSGPARTSHDGRDGESAEEPAKNQPGGEPAKNQPGGEPARNQPGGEPAKNRPVPGAAQRDDRAEGDR